MRLMKRNLSTIHYCLYQDQIPILDEEGYESGEYENGYGEALELKCSVSPATGYAQTEVFGNLDSYDKVIVTDNMDSKIDENSLLFVDKEPEFDSDGKPIPDYVVRRVAKSLNVISYAVRKVKVSE